MQKLPLVPTAAAKGDYKSMRCADTGKTGGEGNFCAPGGLASTPCGAGARAARDSGDRPGDPGRAP